MKNKVSRTGSMSNGNGKNENMGDRRKSSQPGAPSGSNRKNVERHRHEEQNHPKAQTKKQSNSI